MELGDYLELLLYVIFIIAILIALFEFRII